MHMAAEKVDRKRDFWWWWWANPGDPIQLWAIQFIQITVIQFGLHAARPGLAAPGSPLDHQPVVIELSPLPLSSPPPKIS